MPDNPGPPPLPPYCPPKSSPPVDREPVGRVSTWIAWAVIIASVVYCTYSANFPKGTNETANAEDKAALVAAGERAELALLKIQGRYFIGVSTYPMMTAELEKSLQNLGGTPKGKIVVALIQAYISPGESGTEKAQEMLDKIDSEKDAELIAQVRKGLTTGIDSSTRSQLEKQLGWFTELLRPAGDDSDSYRAPVDAVARKTVALVVGIFMLAGMAICAGLVLGIIALVKKSNGTLKIHYQPDLSWDKKHVYLEAFAVYIFIMALGQFLGDKVPQIVGIICYAGAFILGLLWPFIRGVSWNESRKMMGWNRGQGFFKEVCCGLVGYLVVLFILGCIVLVMLIGFLIYMALTGGLDPAQGGAGAEGNGIQGSHPIVGMLDSAKDWRGRIALFLLAAAAAPLLEETMFRGAFVRYMRHRWGFFLAAIIGGVIFAVVHPQGWVAVPALTTMGLGFAMLREWRDSLIAPMTAHAVHNGSLVVFMILLLSS